MKKEIPNLLLNLKIKKNQKKKHKIENLLLHNMHYTNNFREIYKNYNS